LLIINNVRIPEQIERKCNLKKITTFFLSLVTVSVFILSSCSTQSSLHGLWQDTNAEGTIEFKTNGEVIIIDNMSATLTGTFKLNDNNVITFEFTATDIMKDSIQPMEKTIVTARVVKFNNEELQLSFADNNEVEYYKRI
jgi:hypothetical protein